MDEREAIEQLRNGRVNTLTNDVGDIKVSIGKIEVTLTNMAEALEELRDCHTETQTCLNALNVDIAARPDPSLIRNTITKVERHETFFMILGAAITIISIKILGFFDKFFQ